MQHFPPLFAAAGDIIQIIVVILFIVVPVIGQLLTKLNQAKQPGGGAGPKKPPAEVADEIEDFMRRVLGGKEEPREQPAARPKPHPEPAEQPISAVIIEEEPQTEELSEHVKRYFEPKEPVVQPVATGREIATATTQFKQHVHEAFDHKLSQLDATPPRPSPEKKDATRPPAEVPPTFAAGLAAMLSSSESLAQAIVVSEIIHRPEERWS